jgi:hypothetical protein
MHDRSAKLSNKDIDDWAFQKPKLNQDQSFFSSIHQGDTGGLLKLKYGVK